MGGVRVGTAQKTQDAEEPLVSKVRTHIELESMEATGGALADGAVERAVGLGGHDHFQDDYTQNIYQFISYDDDFEYDECDLLEHKHKVNY